MKVISGLFESSCSKASKARRLEEEAITTRAGDRRGLTFGVEILSAVAGFFSIA